MSSEPVAAREIRLPQSKRAQRMAKTLSETARRLRFSRSGRLTNNLYRVRRGRRLLRLIAILSFVFLIVLPGTAGVVYFGLIAADQYVSEARFAVRSGSMAGVDALASVTGIPSIQIIQDTQVVTNFIESRALVEALMRNAALKERYSRPEADFYARLNPETSIERVVKYWNSMTKVGIEMPGGIVILSARAFRPDDAAGLAEAVVQASEQLVNDMNDRARQDSLSNAEKELQLAAGRLSQARAALELARNKAGILDTSGEAKKTNTLIEAVRMQLLDMQQQYNVYRRSVSDDAPQMRNLHARIEAAEQQITRLQGELTTSDAAPSLGTPLSASITRLAALDLDRQVAETQYTSAAATLERARIASTTKQIYLTSFVSPVAAEEARFPRRIFDIGLTLALCVLAWLGAVGGAKYAINRT